MSLKHTKTMINSRAKAFIIFALILLISVNVKPAVATVTDGVEAYKIGDYERAEKEWKIYANLGNIHALFNLGQLYRMGRGVVVDNIKAAEYYRQAAEKGHIGAQSNLGTLHYFSKIPSSSIEKAVQWWKKAAANGDKSSQYMIGVLYHNGEHLDQNNIKSYTWLYLSAQSNYPDAIKALQKLEEILSDEDIQEAKKDARKIISKIPTLFNNKPTLLNNKYVKKQLKKAPIAKQAKTPLNPVQKTTSKPKATDAAMETQILDNFRIQIAAYHREAVVYQSYKRLLKKYPNILKGYQVKSQKVTRDDKVSLYRMQIAPFETRLDAAIICDKFKKSGLGCFVVKIK